MFVIKDVKTGKEMELNVYAGDWLRRLNFGLFRKVVSIPKDPKDCQIVARKIRNMIHLLEACSDLTLEKYNISKETPEFLSYMNEVAKFIENAEYGISFPLTDNNPLKKAKWHDHCYLEINLQLNLINEETDLLKKGFPPQVIKANSLFSLEHKIMDYLESLPLKDSKRFKNERG